MILRIRRLFIKHLKRLPIQLRKFPLEPNPIHPCNIIPIIILDEQRQIVCISEFCSLHLQLLNIIGLGDGKSLRGLEVRGGREVEVVHIVVDFESLGTAVGGGGTDEDGVQF